MKYLRCLSLLMFLLVCKSVIAQEYYEPKSINGKERNDGPYLIYNENKVKIISVKYGDFGMKIKADSFDIQELTGMKIKVRPNADMPPFTFKIFKYEPEPAHFEKPEKLLVVSDVEGNFEDLVNILKVSGVINKKYEWTYGKNHLLINGDLVDRGDDVMALLWLCYKLDNESMLSGGKVHINLGNHDEMDMSGDTRYVDKKYLYLDSLLKINHQDLFGTNTEIGRWLRTKNAMTIIDSSLFVHGGAGIDLIRQNLTVDQINQIVRENLGKDITRNDTVPYFIFGGYGPFWYRGYLYNNVKFRPITPAQLDEVLSYFGVKQVVVGHCIVPEIAAYQGGKIIAADVDHPQNRREGKSRALLITNNKFYTINDKGKIVEIPVKQGFEK